MGDVNAVVASYDVAKRDQFLSAGIAGWRVDQGRGYAECAVLHGVRQHRGHRRQLSRGCLAHGKALAPLTNRASADEGTDVDGNAVEFQPGQPVAETRPRLSQGKPFILIARDAAPIVTKRIFNPPAEGRRGPALAHDLGRHALGDFRERAAVGKERDDGVRLDIDEARADNMTGGVNDLVAARRLGGTGRDDVYDLVSSEHDIAVEPGVA